MTASNNPTYTDKNRHNAPMRPYGGLCRTKTPGVDCCSITMIKTRNAAVFELIYNNRRAGAYLPKGRLRAPAHARGRYPCHPAWGYGRGWLAARTASRRKKKKKNQKKENWAYIEKLSKSQLETIIHMDAITTPPDVQHTIPCLSK